MIDPFYEIFLKFYIYFFEAYYKAMKKHNLFNENEIETIENSISKIKKLIH